jgi:predicted nucleotidyltransferase
MIKLLSREFLTILARKGRVEIIRTLKSYPDRDFTINELSRTSRVPTMTTWRAVKELKRTGLVRTRKIGNAIGVTLTEDRERLRVLRMIPDTDPQRTAAGAYASRLGEQSWVQECRLFGSIGRGEHAPGEEVDVAVVYDDSAATEGKAKEIAVSLAALVKEETNVTIVPLCIAQKEMTRKGGLAAELRDKEIIWRR